MVDRMDDILRNAAEQADARVDYAAMHASILKKAQGKKQALRRDILRYASAAAAVLLLAGVSLRVLGRSNLDLMRGAEGQSAAYGATPESMLDMEKSAGEEDGVNSASIAPDEVPEAFVYATGAPTAGSSVEDAAEPPSFCGSGCAALYWAQEELELPAVTFGTQSTIDADATGFRCTVSDGTQKDAEEYLARVLAMYPGSFQPDNTDDAQREPGSYVASVSLMDGAYLLTISTAQANVIIDVIAVND